MREAGHEVMAHIPMEPLGSAEPGPGALLSDANPVEMKSQLDVYLDSWRGYVVVKNRMGGKLMADQAGMDVAMTELRERGSLWLNSRTGATMVGEIVAAAFGAPPRGARHISLYRRRPGCHRRATR